MTLDLEQLERQATEAEKAAKHHARPGSTHWEDCWKIHIGCALHRYATDVRALVERVRALEAGFDVTR